VIAYRKAVQDEAKINNFPSFYKYLESKENLLIDTKLIRNSSRESYKQLTNEILKNKDKNYWSNVIDKLNLKDEVNFFSSYHNPVAALNLQLKLNNKPDCNILQLSYMNDIIVKDNLDNLLMDMWLVTNFDDKYSRLNFTYTILYVILRKGGIYIFS